MMRRAEKTILIGLVVVLAILMLLMIYQSIKAEDNARTYNISVLVRTPSERYRKGLDQAALDYNVDVHLLSAYDKEGGAQQETYLRRELVNNADAIVLGPEDPFGMQEFLVDMNMRAMVVTVGERLQHQSIVAHVGVNNAEMGRRLGELLAERVKGLSCIIILPDDISPGLEERYNIFPGMVERFTALKQTLLEYGMAYESVQFTTRGVANMLFDRPPQAIVALDAALLPELCAIARETDQLFGAGYVSGIRTQLESGRINSLVVYSEFDEGYLSMRAAVEAAGGKLPSDMELGLYVADADNMYTPPLEQILFPIG